MNPNKGYIIMWKGPKDSYHRAVFLDGIKREEVKAIASSLAAEEGHTEAIVYETMDHWRVLFNTNGTEVADKGAA